MTEKLKNAAIQSEFTTELERKSAATREQLLQLQEQHARRALPTQTFIDRSHTLVVDMIQCVAAKVLSSPNPTHCGGHPRDVEARERNYLRAPGHNPLRRSKVNPGSPMGQPWVPDFWGATVGSRTKIVNRGSPRPAFSFACGGQPDQIVNL